MDNLTLRQLRYFEALAKFGHFGHAAEASAVSQPALSVQIKELEDNLGVQLFERTSRSVQLTAIGEDFAVRVRQILQSVDELGEMARASGQLMSGKFRLGVIPTIAPYLLPQFVADMTKLYPSLDLQIRETLTPRLIEDLRAGQLDAAILALPISEPFLTEVPLFDEALMLVRPIADQEKPVPAPTDLGEMRVLMLEEGHCFRDQALSFCALDSGREGLDGSSLSTLVQMVGAGLGVTLIPEMAKEVETKAAPVCVDRFKGAQPKRTVGMVWRKTSPLAAKLNDIADIARRAAVPTDS